MFRLVTLSLVPLVPVSPLVPLVPVSPLVSLVPVSPLVPLVPLGPVSTYDRLELADDLKLPVESRVHLIELRLGIEIRVEGYGKRDVLS